MLCKANETFLVHPFVYFHVGHYSLFIIQYFVILGVCLKFLELIGTGRIIFEKEAWLVF